MSRLNTFRTLKFKGLNKSTNPHNIDDAEMVELDNLEVTKNNTLQSRRGHEKIGDASGTNYIQGIHKVAWSPTDTRLYYLDKSRLKKMDEDAGTVTDIEGPFTAGGHPTFLRYKNKTLFLNPGDKLKWFDTDESIDPVQYPRMSAGSDWADYISASADGELEGNETYQYAISLLLGESYADGETALSEPLEWEAGTIMGPEGPIVQHRYGHPFGLTTTDNRTLAGTDVEFSGQLHGYEVRYVKLWRRKAQTGGWSSADDTFAGMELWTCVDEAAIDLDTSDDTYSLTSSLNNIITDITGTYDSGDDAATLEIDFTDDGTARNDESQPLDPTALVDPKALFMTRLHNRISVAHIHSDNPHDTKAVYYSYRGWNQMINDMEIPDFMYPNPMLIFPYTNKYYCDAEDTEDKITAHRSFGNSIVTFTGHCMFVWQEGMFDPVKVSDTVGCIAHDTVCEFEGKFVWLADTGIYTYDGSKLENITFEKMQPYIDDMNNDAADFASAVIYDRKYFITGPFGGSSINDLVLVYDFDLEEWHTRTFQNSAGNAITVDCFHVHHDGTSETLYAAVKDSSATCYIAKMESTYMDDGHDIDCTLKTKYFDMKAPDVRKTLRGFKVDTENYAPAGLTIGVYVDGLEEPSYSFTHTNTVDGFILNSATDGRLNADYLMNLSDEMLGFSLPRGTVGSRFQLSLDITARGAPLKVHALTFDWRAKGRTQRKYGG